MKLLVECFYSCLPNAYSKRRNGLRFDGDQDRLFGLIVFRACLNDGFWEEVPELQLCP